MEEGSMQGGVSMHHLDVCMCVLWVWVHVL